MKTNSGTRAIQLRFVGIGNSESFGRNKHHNVNSNANVEHFVSSRQARSREYELSLPHRDVDYDVNFSGKNYLFSQTEQIYLVTTACNSRL